MVEERPSCCSSQIGNYKFEVLCKAFRGEEKRNGSEKEQPFAAFLCQMCKRDKCSIMCSMVLDEGD